MDVLEVLHKKVRDLGGVEVRRAVSQKLPESLNHHKFNAIIAGVNPMLPEIESRARELWPEDFTNGAVPDQETISTAGQFAVNQLNFTILMPVRNNFDPATVNSIVGLVRRTGCGWISRPFDSMIARSRNMLAAAFLRSNYEWSLWLDDDMIVPNGEPGWFKASISRDTRIADEYAGMIAPYQLVSWSKSIVSAVYFSRHGGQQITGGFPTGTSIKNRLPHKGLLPANYCGFGCVMIHRKVYEDILVKHPELWKARTDAECQVFSTFQDGDHMAGEDQAFCNRANEAGHPTFFDMSVICGHSGRAVYYIPETLK